MKRVLFAGGGTAGHLVSGISVAQRINNRCEVHFMCSPRESDSNLLNFHKILHRVVHTTNRPPWNLQTALFESTSHMVSVKPDLVVGLGGYASVPALMSAELLGIPFCLIEQNIVPGKVNRLFSRMSRRFYSIWEIPARFNPGHLTTKKVGGIVKDGLIKHDKGFARKQLGIDEDGRVLLVLGGSQGSAFINDLIPKVFRHIPPPEYSVVHVAVRDHGKVQKIYDDAGIKAKVFGFVNDMSLLYSAADAAICRSGAGTICELAYYRLPAILIPFEKSADGHQIENARYLARHDAARVIREETATQESVSRLLQEICDLKSEIGNRLQCLIGSDGADIIAGELLC